jgi:hypothetical protein
LGRYSNYALVARQDRAIDPNLERELAKKIRATTIELDSSHVVMLSHPNEVASFIEQATSKLGAVTGH